MPQHRPQQHYNHVAEVFTALASPTRIQIVVLLHHHDLPVGNLAEQLAVSQPLTSQHLRVLKNAGIVSSTRHGRQMVYHLEQPHIAELVQNWTPHNSIRNE